MTCCLEDYLVFLGFYQMTLRLVEQHRDKGIFRLSFGWWSWVGLFKPEFAEKLLRSTEMIQKSADYEIMEPWVGLGLVTR